MVARKFIKFGAFFVQEVYSNFLFFSKDCRSLNYVVYRRYHSDNSMLTAHGVNRK